MKHMSLREIAQACGGIYHGDPALAGREVENVAIDSRKIKKDGLFIAIRGARADGHSFIPQVMESGALCALSEKSLGDVPYPYIQVDSCLQALKSIAEHYRKSLDIKVVGITGSVGKTSTKEMIASILSQKYCVLKTEGNYNNEIGLPLTVFNLREEHQAAVLEMGISEFGEMSRLSKIARPDICVFTNIGFAHLESLGSRDGILKAKTEMLEYMNPNGVIILNGDDDKLRSFRPSNGLTPVYYGLNAGFPFHAEAIVSRGIEGTDALFATPSSSFRAHIPLPGSHMVYNALAGIATGIHLGLSKDELIAGIESLTPIPGRSNLIRTGCFSIIDDCYNANPASMKSSLSVLADSPSRTVAILGDMFELGPREKEMHRDVGRYAAEQSVDVLVCIGPLSAEMAQGARDALEQEKKDLGFSAETANDSASADVYHFPTKEAFFQAEKQILQPGDTILVKASHGMEFSKIVERLQNEEIES